MYTSDTVVIQTLDFVEVVYFNHHPIEEIRADLDEARGYAQEVRCREVGCRCCSSGR